MAQKQFGSKKGTIIFGQSFAILAIVQSICMTMLDYYLLTSHAQTSVIPIKYYYAL